MKSIFSALVLGAVLIGNSGCARNTGSNPGIPAWNPDPLRENEFHRDQARFSTSPDLNAGTVDVQSYRLSGSFDWETKTLHATVEVSVRFLAATSNLVLNSKVDRIESVRSDLRALPFTVDEKSHLLRINVADLLTPGDAVIRIGYQAGPRVYGGLNPVQARRGDPVASRVVYTTSEPESAQSWMPCVDRPADRARFEVDFRMPKDEMLIANGDLVSNTVEGESRHVSYSTRYSLPTYLMAFAMGELSEATTWHGALPVSIWARRGLDVDYKGLLAETVRQIRHYEKLLGAFPFEKYAVVLLPEMGGGIEHASITFDDEMGSSQAQLFGDRSLMAHELGHQWFGDAVTVASWDDLWIKEGMATLLSWESMRPTEDRNGSGRLFGDFYHLLAGDAIRDAALPPERKYTSGPYDRSAWFLTQLRAIIGENAFWGTLRKVLAENRFGTIGTERFMEYFRPRLSEAAFERALKAIDAKKIPELSVQGTKITLKDEEDTLLVPLSWTWVRSNGERVSFDSVPGAPIDVSEYSRGDGFLIQDPRDIHPLVRGFVNKANSDYGELIAPLLMPRTEQDLANFLAGPATSQFAAFKEGIDWRFTPESFLATYPRLSSEVARASSINSACWASQNPANDSVLKDRWRIVLDQVLGNPALLGLTGYIDYFSCSGTTSPGLFGDQYAIMQSQPQSPLLSEIWIEYLRRFAMKSDQALKTWMPLLNEASDTNARGRASAYLTTFFQKLVDNQRLGPEEIAKWQEAFREALSKTRVDLVYFRLVRALGASADLKAFATLAEILREPDTKAFYQIPALCAAYQIANADAIQGDKRWRDFLAQLGPQEALTQPVREALAAPKERCSSRHLR